MRNHGPSIHDRACGRWRNMLGRTFAGLHCLAEAGSSTSRQRAFVVECVNCAKRSERLAANLRRAERKGHPGCSCRPRADVKHGLWDHPLYKRWEGMLRRCHNPKHVQYKSYGGRGIVVCDEWRASPALFVTWGEANGLCGKKQIDRIDNNGPYSPDNCRVVAPSTNANNKRNNHHLVVGGVKMTIAEASNRYGVGKTTIRERLRRGWTDDKAVSDVGRANA